MPQKSTLAMAAVLVHAAAFCSPATAQDTPAYRSTTDHFIFYAPPSVSDAEVKAVAERAEAAFDRTARFVGRSPEGPSIRYFLYPTLEEKGLATGYTLPAHALAGAGEVFAALEPGFDGESDRVIAHMLLRRTLGPARSRVLEMGVAMYLAENWRGRGYRYWAARIGNVGGCADLGSLLDNRRLAGESYLIARPLAASFIAWAIEAFGRENLLEKYASWEPHPGEIEALQAGWRRYLKRLYPTAVERAHSRPAQGPPDFQKGFCHAHEGYQVHNGYISRRSDQALEKLSNLGVNAVSLTPFTYMRNTRSPAPFPFSNGTGAENDESIVHAATFARKLGLAVMIKPHVWVRGSWPGEVEMDGDEEWDLFFDYYWRWIRHYAVLAEMYQAEILCVGVELSRTTIEHEVRWREIFGRVRQLYGGLITYAANWGDEVEQISFWDGLDFIGVNFYYPLAEDRDPSDVDLRKGVDRALDRIDEVARRWGKSVVITEVGFTSTPSPWIKPYERDRRAPPNEKSQARCYRAFGSALAEREGYAGVYWWKWPSFLEYGGPRHSGYTPNGKIAEEVVKRWFAAIPEE
jgi:hypothetical protein